MRAWVERHETAAFVGLTFALSWPLWFASGTLGRTPVRAPDLAWLVAQIGVCAPAFAGLALAAWLEPGGGRRAWRALAVVYLPALALGAWIATRGFASFVALDAPARAAVVVAAAWALWWFGAARRRPAAWPGAPAGPATVARWSLVALLGPTALFAAAWGLVGPAHGAAASVPALDTLDLTLAGLLQSFTVNLLFGGSLGEEPGWRGAWLPRLLRGRTPLAASALISLWWALWHAPIDWSQGFLLPGPGALVIRQAWALPIAVLFTWVTLRAGGSLLPPFLFHTAVNSVPDFALADPARYERSALLFWLLMVGGALAVALADGRMSRPTGARAP